MPLAESADYLKQPSYPVVKLERPFTDTRGVIQNLTTKGCQSVAVLHSAAGTQRANHIHKTDEHLTYVVSGRLEYLWQDVTLSSKGEVLTRGPKQSVIVSAGQSFFTPASVAHCMHFLEDTVIVTVAPNARDHTSHESDLVRVPSLVDSRE